MGRFVGRPVAALVGRLVGRGTGRADRRAALVREAPLALAFGCLLAALWLPPIDAPRPVHRYQVTFDVSQSMDVEDAGADGAPLSRLAFARRAAADLVRGLPCGSRVGWSAFVERRTMTLATPLEVCDHYDALRASLDGIDGRMRWGQASGVGKGLHQSLRAAHAIGDGTAVVMLSDGHEAPPLAPGRSGLPKLDGLDVRGVVAGVGGDTPVPIPKTDAGGRPAGYWQADEVVQRADLAAGRSREELSRLDETHLRSLAELAGLGYVRLAEPGDLLAALEGAGLAREVVVPTDFRHVPTWLALALLCWRFAPVGGRGGRSRR